MIDNRILVEYLADTSPFFRSVFLLFYLHMRLLSDLCSTPSTEPVLKTFLNFHYYCGKFLETQDGEIIHYLFNSESHLLKIWMTNDE